MSVDKALRDSGVVTKKGNRHGGKHESDIEMPGWAAVADAIKRKYRVRTIPELGTDKENIYYYNGQIYERAEEILKSEAHAIYVRSWTEILNRTTDPKVSEALESALRKGPSTGDINEVLNNIRRTTLSYDQMNPETHIPFANGLLNLKTRRLDPFTPDLFYTYQVDANLLDRYVTLRDMPLFGSLLYTVFYEPSIPMALSYASYTLRPDFPIHKTLFILGRERIGKGTFTRVIQGLMKKGSGAISLARLLTGERFQFSGIEGKNLLVDSETKRKFRKGTVLEWGVFCNLFGNDILSIEPKGKEAHDYVSKAKGIFLGNLPFIPVDSPPAISRILVIETRNERPKRVIPNLDEKILANERDMIATLLVQVMFKLEDREFLFPGQLTDDATTDILDKLADPVSNFVEEMTEYQEGINTSASDAVSAFVEWCNSKGISPLKPQMFKKGFGKYYTKKLLGPRGGQEYFYINCKIFDTETELEIQSSFQVDYGENTSKTPKTSLSGDRYRRNQHECVTLRVGEEDHVHDMRVDTLMLITGNERAGEPKTKAQNDNEPVINLQQEFPKKDTTQPSNINGKPRDSDTGNKTGDNASPITLDIKKSLKTHDPGHAAELNADPTKSVVQSQEYSITEKEGKLNPGHAAELNADPVKSDAQSEIHSITEEDGKLILDQLLALGYHMDNGSGPTIDGKYFKLGIHGIERLPEDSRERFLRIMENEHFEKNNRGIYNVTWFVRPLAKTSKGGEP
jgi:phage/plasmid-associated DNA primase